uniref:RING-type domain-containing protein n=1 Tax=Sinocyclocheilus anshuiensis TaxID=1608454 RepID=A0A671P3G0_9TELE
MNFVLPLICPVCLDLLKDPVMILCGHNYCKKCITDIWDQDDQKGIYRCPLCKQSFTPRPVLGKNMMVAEMVEKLKKKRLQATPLPDPPADPPASVHTGSGDVQCDSCTEIKQKAVKSCLDCRSSYCQNHLEQHESLFKGKKHNLMDATGRLQEMILPITLVILKTLISLFSCPMMEFNSIVTCLKGVLLCFFTFSTLVIIQSSKSNSKEDILFNRNHFSKTTTNDSFGLQHIFSGICDITKYRRMGRDLVELH